MNATFDIDQSPFHTNLSAIVAEWWFVPLDILTTLCSIFIVLLAASFLLLIALDKASHTVSMLLVANSCLTALITGCSVLSMSVFTFGNDLGHTRYADVQCIMRAYMGYVSYAQLNYSFFLQAMYQYILVVYPTRLVWQSARFQASVIVVTWIYGWVYLMPCLMTNGIRYNADNQICQIPLQHTFFIIYGAVCGYTLPISLVIFIYFKLVRYVREMSTHVTCSNQFMRVQREVKMVRRTVIIVTILIAVCFPYTLIMILSFCDFTLRYHFRIAYVFVDASILSIMITLFQFIDPLKTSLMKRMKWGSNTVSARTPWIDQSSWPELWCCLLLWTINKPYDVTCLNKWFHCFHLGDKAVKVMWRAKPCGWSGGGTLRVCAIHCLDISRLIINLQYPDAISTVAIRFKAQHRILEYGQSDGASSESLQHCSRSGLPAINHIENITHRRDCI